MDDIFVLLLLLAIVTFFISLIGFVVKLIMKKPKKKWGIVALSAFVLFWAIGFFWGAISCNHEWIEEDKTAPTCEIPGFVTYYCSLCAETKSEEIDPLGHDMRIVSRTEPTETLYGEIVKKCDRCGFEQVEKIDKLSHETDTTQQPTTEQETNTTSQPTQEPETTEPEKVDTSTTYEEIYRAYKANELRADDTYKNNRYRVTAKINGMATGGLFNLTGGATLTMEIRIDNTIVFFYAEFEKEQEESLKTVNVGDTVTFEGECLSAGTWVECELIQ